MSVSPISIDPNPTTQTSHLSFRAVQALSGLTVTPPINLSDFEDVTVFTGIVECAFKAGGPGIGRDDLLFNLRDPNEELADLRMDIDAFKKGAAVVSLASFAYDGPMSDALWAVDRSTVGLTNEDSGTGTASVQVQASLAA